MPDRETILERTSLLPLVESPITTGIEYSDEQIWEGDEEGAHFKVTKEQIPFPQLPPLYSLSVSGEEEAMEKIISDFIEAFGPPLTSRTVPELPGIHFVLWNADLVDRKRS